MWDVKEHSPKQIQLSQLKQKMWQEITDKINARNLAVTWNMDEEMKKYENKYYSVGKKGESQTSTGVDKNQKFH